jgi:hypothetical protein
MSIGVIPSKVAGGGEGTSEIDRLLSARLLDLVRTGAA